MKNKQTTLLLYYIKDEYGESLVFQLKLTQSGKDVIKFGMEQVVKLLSKDISNNRITFFIVDENLAKRRGELSDKIIADRWIKLFISDASWDSLKQMIIHMNTYHQKMKNNKIEKENAMTPQTTRTPGDDKIRSHNKINLNEELQKLSRKKKLKALMSVKPTILKKHFSEEKKKHDQNLEETKDEVVCLDQTIDPSKWYICKLPESLLYYIFNFNSKIELNEIKKTNKYMNELIASKRRILYFEKSDIPTNIFKNLLTKSLNLEELYFRGAGCIKSNDVFAWETLNLLNLKVLDLMGLSKSFNERAWIRLITRSKNIEELRVNCAGKITDAFFYCIRNLRKLEYLTISSLKTLSDSELVDSQTTLKSLSLHLEHLKLKNLCVYEINSLIADTFGKEVMAENLESLRFATINQKDGLDVLKDIIFLEKLKQLAIWYNQTNWEAEEIEAFNSEIIGQIMLDACVKIENLTIGGLLNDEGAIVIAEAMKRYSKISGLKLTNCVLQEDGLRSILEQGQELKILDITGCLYCCTGEAFLKNNAELIYSGTLSNLRDLRMTSVPSERFKLKKALDQALKNNWRLTIQ
jgi:hypothetical protein